MPSTITAEKAALRTSVKEFYNTGIDRRKSDHLLLERFLSLPQVEAAPSLLLFYGTGTEPDTGALLEPLLALGKTVALPRCLPGRRMEARVYRGKEHLTPGPFGIPEPDMSCPILAREAAALILVPNLLCDRRGYRLGQGGGYYDRYLAGFQGFTVALCRDALLRDEIPTQPHDVPVQLVVTETRSLSPDRAERSGAFAPLPM